MMQVKTIARTDLQDTTVWSLHVNNWIGDTPLTQQPVYILVATALGEDVLIHPSGTQEVLPLGRGPTAHRRHQRTHLKGGVMHEHLHILWTDRERDEPVEAAIMADYNGNLTVTVFHNGAPVLYLEPAEDWAYTIVDVPTTGARLYFAGMMYNLGEYSDEVYERWQDAIGTPQETEVFYALGEESQGHELVALVGRVANAVHRLYPDDTPEPKGF